MATVNRIYIKCDWDKCKHLAEYEVFRADQTSVGQFCRSHAEAKRKIIQVEEDAAPK